MESDPIDTEISEEINQAEEDANAPPPETIIVKRGRPAGSKNKAKADQSISDNSIRVPASAPIHGESARSNVHSSNEAIGCYGRNAGAEGGRDCEEGEGSTPREPRKARVERDISPEPTSKEEFRIQGSPRTASRQLMEHLHQQQIERASARERMYQNFLPL